MQPKSYTFRSDLKTAKNVWEAVTHWSGPEDENVLAFYDYPMTWKVKGSDGREWILYACGEEGSDIGYVAAPRMFGMVDIWSHLCSGAIKARTFFELGDDFSYPRFWVESGKDGVRAWKLPLRLIPEDFLPDSEVSF